MISITPLSGPKNDALYKQNTTEVKVPPQVQLLNDIIQGRTGQYATVQ